MQKKLTILVLISAAAVFASCGFFSNGNGGGPAANSQEPIDGVGDGGGQGEEGEEGEQGEEGGIGWTGEDTADNEDGTQEAGIFGKVFGLQDMVFDVHQWFPQILQTDQGGGAQYQVASLFKPECHMYDQVNVCPDGTEVVFENKFSLESIIGLIDHAGMYSSNIFTEDRSLSSFPSSYKNCGVGNNPAELIDHTAFFDPPDSDEFIVDFHDLFDCVATFTSPPGESTHALYSKSVYGKIFASVFTIKQRKGTVSYVGTASSIIQSYLKTNDDGDLQLLASSIASYDAKDTGDFGHRSLVIVNMQTQKVAAKVTDIQGNGTVLLGGIEENGEGYYMVKVGSLDDEYYFCVRGYAEDAAIVDNDQCDDSDGLGSFFLAEGWTANKLYTWLGVDEDDASDLSGFDSFFNDSDFLSESMVPQNNTDYFPDSVSK